jgi:hypothetical protein
MGDSQIAGEAYARAQRAILELKQAVHMVLSHAPEEGLQNAEIGRALGIYMGHEGHQGHVSRTILSLMENEGIVVQISETKKWRLRTLDD